mgnify:CR=1 FL=1
MDKRLMARRVADYFAAIGAQDEAAWVALFAPDAALHDPADAPPLVGETALRGFFRVARGAFAALDLRVENVFSCGNEAAAGFSGEGVGRNGQAVRFEGIDLFAFDADGRILSVRGFWDPAALFERLS